VAAAEDSDRDTDAEGFSVTDSTTSKFEAAERKIEAESFEQRVKSQLKQKVLDILVAKYNLKIQNAEKKKVTPSSPSSSHKFPAEMPRLAKSVVESQVIEEVMAPIPEVFKSIHEKKVHIEVHATEKNMDEILLEPVSAKQLAAEKDDLEKSSPLISEEEGKPTEKVDQTQLGTEDVVHSYSGSFEAESSESSPSLTEERTERGVEAIREENDEEGKEEKEEEEEEGNYVSDVETEGHRRLLSTIEEVSSVERSPEESLSTLRPDEESVLGPPLNPTDDQTNQDRKVSSGQEESEHVEFKSSVPLPEQEKSSATSKEDVQVEEELPVERASLTISHSGDDECEEQEHVGLNKEDKSGQEIQVEIVITHDDALGSVNVEEGAEGNSLSEKQSNPSIKDLPEVPVFIVESQETPVGTSGDSVNKSGTYVILKHFESTTGEEISCDLNISRGDLSPDVSIQVQELEEEQELEDEDDLATNAPSILFDTEEPENGNDRPALLDALPSEAVPSGPVSDLDSSPQALSIGEVLLIQGPKSEGEVSALSVSSSESERTKGAPASGGVAADASSSGSSGEESSVQVRKNKKKSETNLLRNSQLLGRSSTPPSLSEGEWRASPRQMQRLYTMAAAFGLVHDKL